MRADHLKPQLQELECPSRCHLRSNWAPAAPQGRRRQPPPCAWLSWRPSWRPCSAAPGTAAMRHADCPSSPAAPPAVHDVCMVDGRSCPMPCVCCLAILQRPGCVTELWSPSLQCSPLQLGDGNQQEPTDTPQRPKHSAPPRACVCAGGRTGRRVACMASEAFCNMARCAAIAAAASEAGCAYSDTPRPLLSLAATCGGQHPPLHCELA